MGVSQKDRGWQPFTVKLQKRLKLNFGCLERDVGRTVLELEERSVARRLAVEKRGPELRFSITHVKMQGRLARVCDPGAGQLGTGGPSEPPGQLASKEDTCPGPETPCGLVLPQFSVL